MWFYLAVLSALLGATSTITRRTHGASARPIELAWWSQLLTIPFSVLLVLLDHSNLYTNWDFMVPMLASAALCSYVNVLIFAAYKSSAASVITPLGNILPIALVVTSFIMIGTRPSLLGLTGIVLIVAGIYYSSVSGRHSLLQPFKAIWKQRGARAMIGATLLWSVSTNFDKIALRNVSSQFYLLIIQLTIFIFLSLYLSVQPVQREMLVWKHWHNRLLVGSAFGAVAVFLQFKALALASSSLVFAVKRLDTLFVILFAGYFLHEKHILKRFNGALIALVGVVIVYIVR